MPVRRRKSWFVPYAFFLATCTLGVFSPEAMGTGVHGVLPATQVTSAATAPAPAQVPAPAPASVESSLYESLIFSRDRMFFAGLGCGLVIAVAAWVVASRASRQMLKVAKAARQITRGEADDFMERLRYGHEDVVALIGELKRLFDAHSEKERELREVLRYGRAFVTRSTVTAPEGWDHPGAPADVEHFVWDMEVDDVASALEVLSLEMKEGDSFFHVWSDSKHPEDVPAMGRNAINAFLAKASNFQQEFRILDSHGKIRWFRQICVIEPAGPNCWRVLAINLDITEQKEADKALTESEERYRSLFENSRDPIFSIAADGHFVTANPSALLLIGHSLEEAKTLEFLPFCAPDQRETVTEFMTGALRGRSATFETAMIASDGGRREFLMSAAPAIADGKVVGVSCIARDVTERKWAIEALRESEEKFRALAENISQFAWMADGNGSRFWYNQRWYDYTGTTLQDVAGSGWQRLHHPEHLPRVAEKLKSCFDAGEAWEDTFPLLGKDGRYRWFLSRARPIRDMEGKIVRWFGTDTDVTEQRETEQALARAKELAESANKSKDEFLAALSHELRTPLNPVLLVAGMMETDPAIPDELRADFAMIRKNISLEARLIDDLLDLTRISRGKVHLDRCRVDMHAVAEDTLRIVQGDTQEKLLLVTRELGAEEFHVWGDPARLHQVLWNVVKNAVKFTPAGGSILIRSRSNFDKLVLEVADTGVGIASTHLDRIFNAFEQGHVDAARRFGGLGLGLAISKQIVELHGGRISATSDGQGKGATFQIELPVSDGSDV